MKILEFGNIESNTVLIQPVDDHDLAVMDNAEENEKIRRVKGRSDKDMDGLMKMLAPSKLEKLTTEYYYDRGNKRAC